VDEQVREKLAWAIEKSVMDNGAKNYEQGLKQAKTVLEFLLKGVDSIQTKEDLRTALTQLQLESRHEERVALFVMNQIPHLLRFGLKLAAKRAASTLPSIPGGRPSPPRHPRLSKQWIGSMICTVKEQPSSMPKSELLGNLT
jgi:hypothetical protein